MNKLYFFLLILFVTVQSGFGQEKIQLDLAEEYRKGVAFMQANQYEKAVDHIFECQRANPDDLDYALKLAYCYTKLGNYKDAKYSYQSVLQKDSLNINALTNLGGVYEKEYNYRAAQEYYLRLLEIDSTNSYFYKQNGFIAVKNNQVLAAIGYFSEAHRYNPKDLVAISELSKLYLRVEAIAIADEIIERGYQQDSTNLKILYAKADIKRVQKKYPEIITTIERAMVQGDTLLYYQKMLASAYLQTKAYDESLFHLTQIISKRQASEYTHYHMAVALEAQGKLEESIKHYDLAIELGISENIPVYYKNLAKLYVDTKALRAAITAYKEAYEYSGKPEHLFQIARNSDLYYKDKKIALRYYKKYLATKHAAYRSYAKERVAQLKEIIHFQVKS